jgi:hypothetical protein
MSASVRRSSRETVLSSANIAVPAKTTKRIRATSSRIYPHRAPITTAADLGSSKREIGIGIFERTDVKNLLSRIENNDKDYTIVLKVKDQVSSDINTLVMDEIIKAMHRNKVCQAAYVQNLGSAIQDSQVEALIELLKRKCIWALNIGETYHVSTNMWERFCDALPDTNVTHLYVSGKSNLRVPHAIKSTYTTIF